MVCRDARTHKAAPVNPLSIETPEDQMLFNIGEGGPLLSASAFPRAHADLSSTHSAQDEAPDTRERCADARPAHVARGRGAAHALPHIRPARGRGICEPRRHAARVDGRHAPREVPHDVPPGAQVRRAPSRVPDRPRLMHGAAYTRRSLVVSVDAGYSIGWRSAAPFACRIPDAARV